MNPRLDRLHEYPFPRLRRLLADLPAPDDLVDLSIGEPGHPTPEIVLDALRAHLGGLAKYPPAAGDPRLRGAIAGWIRRRYGAELDPDTEVLPVSGTREALFSFCQAVLDPADPGRVALPDPGYQIYEGAAILAGARPAYLPQDDGPPDWDALSPAEWDEVRLMYVCSPGNPAGYVFTREDWRTVFALADRYGFAIAADEPYSELYYGNEPPIGALQAARELGRSFERLVAFNSLSKRSNCPGLRSGFVAGDAAMLRSYLAYRTYHGALPSLAVQGASVAAWEDEDHVAENRRWYTEKMALVPERLRPGAGFFLWLPTDDHEETVRAAYRAGVRIVPGGYLTRGPAGRTRVRVALVPPLAACARGLGRLAELGLLSD